MVRGFYDFLNYFYGLEECVDRPFNKMGKGNMVRGPFTDCPNSPVNGS